MKFFLSLIFISILSVNSFAQTYPNIDKSISYPKHDFSEIDKLIENELPNKAISKLLVVQIMAISADNLYNLTQCYDRLRQVIPRSGKEKKDIEKLFFEQHKLFLKTEGVTRNVAAMNLNLLIQNAQVWQSLSSDDESLSWPIKDSLVKLKLGSYYTNHDPLEDFYIEEVLRNPAALMKIATETIYNVELVNLQPTLFDVYAHDIIGLTQYPYDRTQKCYWQSTEEFAKMDLPTEMNWRAQLEVLNKKYGRWDAYAFNVESRIQKCYDADAKERVKVFEKFYKELHNKPAGNRFAYRIAAHYAEFANRSDWKNPSESDDGFLKAIKIIDKALENYPNTDFTERLQNLKKDILTGSLSFHIQDSDLPSNGTLLKATYRNIQTAQFEVYKVVRVKNSVEKEKNPLNKYELKFVSKRKLTFDKDPRMLKHTKDFIFSDFSEPGSYLVIAGPNSETIQTCIKEKEWNSERNIHFVLFQSTNLEVQTLNEKGRVNFFVSDKTTGKPIQGAEVRIKNRYHVLERGFTDKNGYCALKTERNFSYSIHYKSDSLNHNGWNNSDRNKTKIQHRTYTDRNIYRPGQTVYFKTLSFNEGEEELKFITNEKIEVSFSPGYGDEFLFKEKLSTDEFGATTGSFVLPKKPIYPGYVVVRINGDFYKVVFHVEEYKRPTIEVTFDDPKGTTTLGKPFTMTGKVMAYAGYPITNTEVTIDVSENRYFPWRCIVQEGWRNYDTTITVQTNENGQFEFVYASNKPEEAYGVSYNFMAKAIDLSGEVQTANRDIYLGKTTYRVAFDTKEIYDVNENARVKLQVFNSQNVRQENVSANYSILKKNHKKWYREEWSIAEFQGFSRKAFEKKFPQIAYFPDQKEAFKEVQNGSSKSGGNIPIQGLSAGNYQMEVRVIDIFGDTISRKKDFVVYNPKRKRKQHHGKLWAIPSTNHPKVNEPVTVTFGSTYRKGKLLVTVFGKNGMLSEDYYTIRRRKSLTFTVDEANKQGIKIYARLVKNGRVSTEIISLFPLDSTKQLNLKLISVMEPLRPGEKQSWEMEITQNGNTNSPIELLASMYDASLNQFSYHNWETQLVTPFSINLDLDRGSIRTVLERRQSWRIPYFYDYGSPNALRTLRSPDGVGRKITVYSEMVQKIDEGSMTDAISIADPAPLSDFYDLGEEEPEADKKTESPAPKSIRENFNETAFFAPQIHISSDGKYKWNFTLPDALTQWRLMTFAHTADFKTGYLEKSFESRKELMLETFEPRFWRKGDSVVWVGKVVNLSEKEQAVKVNLRIDDLLDESDVSAYFGNFEQQTIKLQPNESKAIEWSIVVADSCPNFVRFEAEASTSEFADVVRKNMPVLEGRERITLAQNYSFDKKGTYDLDIYDLKKVSDEAIILSYSVTINPQPLWSTMLSLTQVMQPTNEVNESYFNQYFSALLAKKILSEHPKMKQALAAWEVLSESAKQSALEQNEELKTLALAETPWLLEAKNDSEKLRRLGQMLNENHLNQVIADAGQKLTEMQLENGSWSWVGRDRPSWYITQHITKGLVELVEYGIEVDKDVLKNAVSALEIEYTKRFNRLENRAKLKGYGLGAMEIEWLYIRSVLGLEETEASKYYAKLIPKKWTRFNLSTQATIGQWAIKVENRPLAKKIMASFQDKARKSKSLGKYWRGNEYGYGWFENKIETQAKMIAFYRVYGDMNESTAAMQKWLLQQKRTQMWDSQKSSAAACFALRDFGSTAENAELKLVFNSEPDTVVNIGVKSEPFVKKSPTVQNSQTARKGAEFQTDSDDLVFASAQVVYSDKLENIQKSTGEFRAERHYYLVRKGEEIEVEDSIEMQVGDIVRVKIKVISDRDLDFVYLEDPKASGWEPINQRSGYRYESGYYYLSNRDNKTDIFIENLRKGTHIYTYDLKITTKGMLSVGAAKATCYYAPSFTSNTSGEQFVID